jgi:hypothetical protein
MKLHISFTEIYATRVADIRPTRSTTAVWTEPSTTTATDLYGEAERRRTNGG